MNENHRMMIMPFNKLLKKYHFIDVYVNYVQLQRQKSSFLYIVTCIE